MNIIDAMIIVSLGIVSAVVLGWCWGGKRRRRSKEFLKVRPVLTKWDRLLLSRRSQSERAQFNSYAYYVLTHGSSLLVDIARRDVLAMQQAHRDGKYDVVIHIAEDKLQEAQDDAKPFSVGVVRKAGSK